MQRHKKGMQPGWYLLKTRTRQEQRALNNLANQGFEAYCPKLPQKYNSVSAQPALFPGYLFVHLPLNQLDRYDKIRSTRGVANIVRFNYITRRSQSAGRLANSTEETSVLLPQPIPKGNQLIIEVRQTVAYLKDNLQQHLSSSLQAGANVTVCNPLYEHLQATFVKNIGLDRGAILIQYIQQRRTANGTLTAGQVLAEKQLTVKLNALKPS